MYALINLTRIQADLIPIQPDLILIQADLTSIQGDPSVMRSASTFIQVNLISVYLFSA